MGVFKEMIARVGLDAKPFEAGAKRVESLSHKMGHSVKEGMMEIIGPYLAFEGIKRGIEATVQWGARIHDLAQEVGLTAEAFQELSYAAKEGGASQEAMVGFVERLNATRETAQERDNKGNMTPEAAKALDSLSAIGIGKDDLGKNAADLVRQVGKRFEEATNEEVAKLVKPLREVGGRGVTQLIATFRNGMEKKAEEARENGLIKSNDQIDALKEMEDEFDLIGNQIRSDLVPSVIWLGHVFHDLVNRIKTTASFLGGLSTGIKAPSVKDALIGAYNPATMIAKIFSGGMQAAINEGSREEARQEREDQANKQKSKKNLPVNPGASSAEESEEKRKNQDAQKAQAMQKELLESADELDKKQMTPQEKRKRIVAEILELEKKIADETEKGANGGYSNPLTIAETQKDLFKKRSELLDNKIPFKTYGPGDSLSKIGGFMGRAAETMSIQVQKEQLRVQREIAKNTKPNKSDKIERNFSLIN